MIGASYKAINKYKDREARVSWVDPNNGVEWDADGKEPFPFLALPFNGKQKNNSFDLMRFIDMGRDAEDTSDDNCAKEKLIDYIGSSAWMKICQGLRTHPLFTHLQLNGETTVILQLLRHMSGDAFNSWRSQEKTMHSDLVSAVVRMAMDSIGKPIQTRYADHGIDKKTATAAGNEYYHAARIMRDQIVIGDLRRALDVHGTDNSPRLLKICNESIEAALPAFKEVAARVQDPPAPKHAPVVKQPKAPAASAAASASAVSAPAKGRVRKTSLAIGGSPNKLVDAADHASKKPSLGCAPAELQSMAGFEKVAETVAQLPDIAEKLAHLSSSIIESRKGAVEEKDERIRELEKALQIQQKERDAEISRYKVMVDNLNTNWREASVREAEATGKLEVCNRELLKTEAQCKQWVRRFALELLAPAD